jgi:parallel beta-helix repeat protein
MKARPGIRAGSIPTVFVLAVAFGLLAAGAARARAATLVVDDNKTECAHAGYTKIQEAVNAAAPGDLIRVCPGFYPESVTIDKPLTLKGDPDSVEAQDCFTPAAADPARDAIVDPMADGFSIALSLRANGVVVEGLVVQGASVGFDLSDGFSGYRVDHNLIQQNTLFGADMGSAGGTESRVDHNCLRQNNDGLVSELDDDSAWSPIDTSNRGPDNARNLSDARADHNTTFANGSGVEAAGPGQRTRVTFDHNVSRQDAVGIAIQNSTDSAIASNELVRPSFAGIYLGGANDNLQVRSNQLQQGGQFNVRFAAANGFIDQFSAKSHVVMTDNLSTGATFSGISVLPGRVEHSLFSNNTSSGNGRDGLQIASGNTNNTISGNVTDSNARNGIYAAGATGNRFEGNEMLGNGTVPTLGGVDARDDLRASNTWTGNACVTDIPAGTICGVG